MSLYEITGAAAESSNLGSGYAVDDLLTIVGGRVTTPAVVKVTSVGAGGEVTGAVVDSGGSYRSAPGSPAATSGGSGTGVALNLVVGVLP